MIELQQNDPHEGTLRDLAPDLTPMLDILFILLVFFMITSGAVFQSLDLKLPTTASQEQSLFNQTNHIMLEIRPTNYALDGKIIDNFDMLKTALPATLKQKATQEFVIAGDKNIPIERLLKVLTYLQSQGIEAANILMQSENETIK